MEDMQACEACRSEHPIQTMTLMEGCWFCEACDGKFREAFATCDHKWSPHTDEMGDLGQYCERCTGFVRNEDMHLIASFA